MDALGPRRLDVFLSGNAGGVVRCSGVEWDGL